MDSKARPAPAKRARSPPPASPHHTGHKKPVAEAPPAVSMTLVYSKLFESEMRRKLLFEVHEFHQNRRQLQRVGFSDSFKEIASMPSLVRKRRTSNTPAPAQTSARVLLRSSSLPPPSSAAAAAATQLPQPPSIGEKPLKSKASCIDLFGKEISPRLDTLERFRTNSLLTAPPEEPSPTAAFAATRLLHPHMLSSLASPSSGRTLEIVRGMRRKLELFQNGKRGLQIYPLPRGGHSVQTRIGPIQIGLPPETIKDSMNIGLKFPTIFIIPQQRFHPWRMISVAEFEFPAYFNFFVLQRAVRLITTKSGEIALRCMFQESLLGPVDLSREAIREDFAPELSVEHWPQFPKERLYFGDNDINKLLEFVPLQERSTANRTCLEADLEDDMVVRLEANELGGDSFVIMDRREVLQSPTSAPPATTFTEGDAAAPSPPPRGKRRHRRSLSDIAQFPCDLNRRMDKTGAGRRTSELGQTKAREVELARLPGQVELPNFRSFSRLGGQELPAFVPPHFGVTLLGTSHGFDRESSTTGFVVWINGMGMVVDPPPNSTPMLELMGIAPRQVQHVLITHCHADHDAGTMQKIMLEDHVTVVTTNTIMKSFVRKYSAVSDLAPDRITEKFTFRAARVGEWLPLLGGSLRVFYSFHTIPTIGFQVRFGGKSLVYSGDTFFHPEEIGRLATVGVLSPERAQDLLAFPWDSDLILHECGVAPIHSPLVCLGQLPSEVKSRLYLVHVTASSVAKDENLTGIRLAKDGIDNTLVLDVELSGMCNAQKVMAWIKDSAAFRGLDCLASICDLASILSVQEYAKAHEFACGDRLVIIAQGSCQSLSSPSWTAERGDAELDQRPYKMGDCLSGSGRFVVLSSKLVCLTCRLHDLFALPSKQVARALLRWKTEEERNEFAQMDLVSCLTRREQVHFTGLFTRSGTQTFRRGDRLWEAGRHGENVYIVLAGAVGLTYCVKDDEYTPPQHQDSLWQFARLRRVLAEEYKPFLCDLPALYHGLPLRSTLVCESDEVVCYLAPASQLLEFLRSAPALFAKLHHDFLSEASRVQPASTSSSSSSSSESESDGDEDQQEEL